MNHLFKYLISGIIGYLIGSLNLAYFLSKRKNINLRDGGSGNLGASNAVLLLGKKAGILTCIHDIMKAFIVVFIFKKIFPEENYIYIFSGVMAIIGHMFPFYLKFKGGKGFASYLGTMLGINLKYFVLLLLVLIIVSLLSDYIVLGTLTTVTLSPIYVFFTYGIIPSIFLIIISLIIIYKHKVNIIRIKNKTEFRISSLFKKENS